MKNNLTLNGNVNNWLAGFPGRIQKQVLIGVILAVALFAFEMFNFDTTRYALDNLLGPVSFFNIRWAAILAIAFCSIDFAGLVRLFTPERGRNEPREVWYLMGAWLLGATMNALMTWWAVSLTLLNHQFGNEVLSREQLLRVVPIFVAVLVWLTRILFIGSLTVAGEHLMTTTQAYVKAQPPRQPAAKASQMETASTTSRPGSRTQTAAPARPQTPPVSVAPAKLGSRPVADFPRVTDDVPAFLSRPQPVPAGPTVSPTPIASRPQPEVVATVVADEEDFTTPAPQLSRTPKQPNGRVRQRPPMPGNVRPASLNADPRKQA